MTYRTIRKRRLTMEPLEHRHLLATLVVDSVEDIEDGDYSPGNLTLREAISQTNDVHGTDYITFDDALSDARIVLQGEPLVIRDSVVIDASSLESNVTIDALGRSDVMKIERSFYATTLRGLTVTGGLTAGLNISRGGNDTLALEDCSITNNLGVGIQLGNNSMISISNSVISNNSAGGINNDRQGTVHVLRSTVRDNTSISAGGGIFNSSSGHLLISESTISGNSSVSNGGGLYIRGFAEIRNSTISGNTSVSDGGGLYNRGSLEIRNSTIVGNSSRFGGGIATTRGLLVVGSTISANTATRMGGGIELNGHGDITIIDSTITRNTAVESGGGMSGGQLRFFGSIITGNTSLADANFSGWLVEEAFSLIDVDAMLGPLADNGGPTWTHALLPGSPAIDAGDPARMLFNGSTQYFDQRGIGFDRVVGRRIDIGAVERQISPDFNLDGIIDGNDIDLLQANVVHGPSAPTLFDLSGDGVVDTADRDQWLIEAGAANLPSNRPYPLGDANLDGVVDISDFNIWNENKFSFVSHWTSGDFSADGAIDTSDFSIWNEHKFLTADSLPVFTSPRQPLDRNTKNRRIGLNFGARHVAAETIEDDPPTLLSQNVIAAVMKDMIEPK